MFKRLITATIVCGIGLSISNYFKFEPFMYFITGGITYGIYDILNDIRQKQNVS